MKRAREPALTMKRVSTWVTSRARRVRAALDRTFGAVARATVLGVIVAMGAAGALTGCSDKPAFTNVDITGATQFGSDFALPDTTGKVRTLADFKGKVVVLFFGYLHCPDVCPTTMAELTQAMQQLGPDAKRVQVLFVTLDPQRDTAPLLAQYVSAFDTAFIGLRPADDAQLAKVAKDFRIYYAKAAGKDGADYTLDHTAASYVFDADGKLRLFARDGQGATPWVHDFKLLLG
jgi:protein SCO1/2